MKKLPDYIITSNWYKEPIPKPLKVISYYFELDHIGGHLKRMDKAMKYAFSEKVIPDRGVHSHLFDLTMLESIINTAYLLHLVQKKSFCPLSFIDPLKPSLFCGKAIGKGKWYFIPRHLTYKEYENPYLVFKRFFKYKELAEWHTILLAIFDASISDYSLCDSDYCGDGFTIYQFFQKMIEAAHLLNVRENYITDPDIK